jgi:hypothetical protein
MAALILGLNRVASQQRSQLFSERYRARAIASHRLSHLRLFHLPRGPLRRFFARREQFIFATGATNWPGGSNESANAGRRLFARLSVKGKGTTITSVGLTGHSKPGHHYPNSIRTGCLQRGEKFDVKGFCLPDANGPCFGLFEYDGVARLQIKPFAHASRHRSLTFAGQAAGRNRSNLATFGNSHICFTWPRTKALLQ